MINDKWIHTKRGSTLKRGPITLGQVWKSCIANTWIGYITSTNPPGWGLFREFPTRNDALRGVVLVTDPKKCHFLRGNYGTL